MDGASETNHCLGSTFTQHRRGPAATDVTSVRKSGGGVGYAALACKLVYCSRILLRRYSNRSRHSRQCKWCSNEKSTLSTQAWWPAKYSQRRAASQVGHSLLRNLKRSLYRALPCFYLCFYVRFSHVILPGTPLHVPLARAQTSLLLVNLRGGGTRCPLQAGPLHRECVPAPFTCTLSTRAGLIAKYEKGGARSNSGAGWKRDRGS